MAQRRMFNRAITESDAFLEMPPTSQLLYFHLAMNADDEGFVGHPKKTMRMCGFAEDDLKILIGKRFVLTFDGGVLVIKHWLIHNTIRMDRFNPTTYQAEKATLYLKENKAYSDNWQPTGNQLATIGIPSGNASKGKLSKVNSSAKAEVDTPFNGIEYITGLINNKRADLQIIGKYMQFKKMQFPSKKAAEQELRRNLKSAGELVEYTPEQRKVATNKAMKMTNQWTLLTVCKYLNK